MAVTHDDVRNIAALARLAVAPERLDAIVSELNGILAHMDALSRIPVAESNAGDTAGMRVAADHGPAVALDRTPSSFAPAWRDGFFLVPRLATHGDAGAVADEEHSA